MNKTTKIILISLTLIMSIYLSFAFVFDNFNANTWNKDEKFMFVLFNFSAIFLTIHYPYEK